MDIVIKETHQYALSLTQTKQEAFVLMVQQDAVHTSLTLPLAHREAGAEAQPAGVCLGCAL